MHSKPDLLFVSHSTPFPPDKGEKIRAFNVIRHLSQRYKIHLGCLMDQASDPANLEVMREWCTTVAGFPIDRRLQKLSALARIRPGRPLMLDYYRQPGLQRWVQATLTALPIQYAYIYTVAMMPYLQQWQGDCLVLDATDIDSEKWATYAEKSKFPMKWVWTREGRTLLSYERWAAGIANATLFVSSHEAQRFTELAPETAHRIYTVENGVDLQHFSSLYAGQSPFKNPGPNLVFTGHMDYWPNIDAVTWFVREVLPSLQIRHPLLQFHIVGANPGPGIMRLMRQTGVMVTGRVTDVRPYLAHADVCIAPLRIARGIQNKVLEAMAMSRPVVVSPQAFAGLRVQAGRDLLVAEGTSAMVDGIGTVLDGLHQDMGGAARAAVERLYAWDTTLLPLTSILTGSCNFS